MEVADSHIYFFCFKCNFGKYLIKYLIKSTFPSPERFSKALFQSKLDITFLIFSHNPKPLAHTLADALIDFVRPFRYNVFT